MTSVIFISGKNQEGRIMSKMDLACVPDMSGNKEDVGPPGPLYLLGITLFRPKMMYTMYVMYTSFLIKNLLSSQVVTLC